MAKIKKITLRCDSCEGTGKDFLSCCGDDMRERGYESDICPTCHEHTGWDGMKQAGKCPDCFGEGRIKIVGDVIIHITA